MYGLYSKMTINSFFYIIYTLVGLELTTQSTLSLRAGLYTVNVLKFRKPESLKKWNMQTVQIQIRLLLSLIRVYTVCHSTKYFKEQLHKKQTLGQKSME